MAKSKRSDRITLEDVARAAGVGTATVDRVMNARGGVSAATLRKVLTAAEELGLRRLLPPPYQPGLRVEIFLTQLETGFIKRLNSAFIRTAATLDRSIIVQRTFYGSWSQEKFLKRLLNTTGNGVIIYGHQTPELIDTLNFLSRRGVQIVAIVSDLPLLDGRIYVGLNNVAAGRTAAYFICKMVRGQGDVIVLCNTKKYSGQQDRIAGFQEGLADYGSEITLIDVVEGKDSIPLSHKLLDKAVRRSTNLLGIYNASAANRAIELALLEHGLAGRTVYVAHELTEISIRLLRSGIMTMLLDQNPETEARNALEAIIQALTRGPESAPLPNSFVPFTIHTADTITEFSI